MNTLKQFILAGLAVLIQQNYGAEIHEEIYNGHLAKPGYFPYQVLLVGIYRDNEMMVQNCGGTIISENVILTVAHCTNESDIIFVYFNMTDTSSIRHFIQTGVKPNALNMTVHRNRDGQPNIIEHENFYINVYAYNDIAVIKLPQSLQFNNYVNKIALPKRQWADPRTFDDWFVVASGYGVTTINESLNPQDLRYAVLHKMKQEDCKRIYFFGITDGVICTDKYTNAGICKGDSGGPLIVNVSGVKYVIGANDWSENERCIQPFPDVYTNVAYYIDWISNKTGIEIN